MIATIRVTNNQEAQTAILMLTAYLAAHGEGTKVEVKETAVVEEKKAPVAEKKAPATKRKPAAKKETPKEEPKEEAEPINLTAIAKEAIGRTDRDTVKALIAEYGGGKISDVPDDKVADLAEALKAL